MDGTLLQTDDDDSGMYKNKKHKLEKIETECS